MRKKRKNLKDLTLLLPDAVQDRLLALLIRSDRWKVIPTFGMLFSSFVLQGADREDLLEVFGRAKDMGADFRRQARAVAERRTRGAAAEARAGRRAEARAEYQKAVMLYFLADWVSFDEVLVAENYRDLLTASEGVDANAELPTEKVRYDWPVGQVVARLRRPDASAHPKPEAGWPLVMIHQGNDTVKETMLVVEDALLDHGFAVLNVDPAGWGESRLSGNGFRSIVDAPMLAQRVEADLDARPDLDADRVAVFGFSGGGTWAAMYASVARRVRAMVTVGGGILNLQDLVEGMPAMQKRQIMKHWRCSEEEIPKIAATIDFDRILPHVTARCLLVHGENDSLVPVEYIRQAARAIAGETDLVIVPGGDHMCSDTLRSEQLPRIGRWLREHLGPEAAEAERSSEPRPEAR